MTDFNGKKIQLKINKGQKFVKHQLTFLNLFVKHFRMLKSARKELIWSQLCTHDGDSVLIKKEFYANLKAIIKQWQN